MSNGNQGRGGDQVRLGEAERKIEALLRDLDELRDLVTMVLQQARANAGGSS